MNSLLSICIPTFNRAEYLKENLNIIIPQAQIYNIPIYISDNNSNDHTQEVLSSYNYKYLFTKTQSHNTGLDNNMFDVIRMSNSYYSWLLGDDDIICSNSLSILLDILKNKDIDFLIMNAYFMSANFKKVNGLLLNIKENISYNNGLFFFEKYWDKIPYGNLIIKTSSIHTCLNIDRYIGTSHAYSGLVFDYIAKNNINILIIAKPLVYFRDCVKTWSSYAFDVYYKHSPKWFELLPIYYNDIKIIKLKEYYKSITKFNFLLHFIKNKIINKNNYHNIDYNIIKNKIYLIKILVYMPQLLIKFIFYFKKIIKKLICPLFKLISFMVKLINKFNPIFENRK